MVVFFDIDDTLIDSELAHVKAIEEICRKYSLAEENLLSVDQVWLNITNKYLKLYFECKISLDQQRIFRIMEFWDCLGQQIDEHQARIIYQRYHHLFLHSCYAFTDVVSSLEQLRACKYKLGIISNGTSSDQLFKLRYNHLIRFFDEIIISEEVGFSKPDKKIFHFAAKKTGITPSSCIYIGDSYDLDYVGSLNSGMKSIWLDRKNSKVNCNCKRIRSLNELESNAYFLKILGEIQ